jgi:uncharacterized membrane protein
MRIWVIAGLLALGGCGSKQPVDNGAAAEAPAAAAGPQLGGVPLDAPIRATDNALTWSLEIAPGAISFTRFADGDDDDDVSQFYPVSPKLANGEAVWTTSDAAGAAVTITLSNADCTEQGAPTVDRPLTAELRVGDKVLKGCAGPRPEDGLDSQPDNSEDANLSDNAVEDRR